MHFPNKIQINPCKFGCNSKSSRLENIIHWKLSNLLLKFFKRHAYLIRVPFKVNANWSFEVVQHKILQNLYCQIDINNLEGEAKLWLFPRPMVQTLNSESSISWIPHFSPPTPTVRDRHIKTKTRGIMTKCMCCLLVELRPTNFINPWLRYSSLKTVTWYLWIWMWSKRGKIDSFSGGHWLCLVRTVVKKRA